MANAFPQLTQYEKGKLYKIVGPVVIGLELIKLPRTEEYRPHFVMYPLWKKDASKNFEFPIILMEYYNGKGLQYSIPYARHNAVFSEILEAVRKQTPISFETDVSLEQLQSLIDWYSQRPPLSAAPNSYLQANLIAAKLEISLFISSSNALVILDQINKKDWDTNHFKSCGISLSNWLQQIQQRINERESFLEQIKVNKQEKKLMRLKESQLIE